MPNMLMLSATPGEVRVHRDNVRKLLRRNEVRQYLEYLAQLAETEAKLRCPVRTGNLRRSITHDVVLTTDGWVGRVGTNVRYAIFQELGTRHHPAQPFLRPAVAAVVEQVAK